MKKQEQSSNDLARLQQSATQKHFNYESSWHVLPRYGPRPSSSVATTAMAAAWAYEKLSFALHQSDCAVSNEVAV